MTRTHFGMAAVLLLGLSLLASCGNSAEAEEKKAQEAAQEAAADANVSLQEAAKNMEEAMSQLADGKTLPVVDFRKLRDLLPEKLAGLPRTGVGGKKTGVAQMQISLAEATYREGDKEIEVTITDTGGMALALVGMASWMNLEIDEENQDGSYTRTTTVNGHKAFENFDPQQGSGETSLVVGNRFMVLVKGSGVAPSDISSAIKELDLAGLAKMK